MLPLLFRIVSDGILDQEETRVGFGLWADDLPIARFVGVGVDDLAVRRVALALFDRLFAAGGAFAAVEKVPLRKGDGVGTLVEAARFDDLFGGFDGGVAVPEPDGLDWGGGSPGRSEERYGSKGGDVRRMHDEACLA